ncbi:outer membrane lipoprotein carrier protein LolA [Desulfovibrio sp. OttesenSCG-928-O18]|nr:outer membrane lipoprotein carrier protein LolA [Desulfovibrio sp. OttesenSCG-928-O18]
MTCQKYALKCGALFLLCLFLTGAAEVAWAGTALAPEKAEAALSLLHAGAGRAGSFQADFVQEKEIPETGATLRARGRVTVFAPGDLRWEYVSPIKAGFALNGNGVVAWSGSGGESGATAAQGKSGSGALSRLVSACLVFNERELHALCSLEVMAGSVVRLVPHSDFARAHVSAMELGFTPDGRQLATVRVVMPRGGNAVFFFSNIVRGGAVPAGPGAASVAGGCTPVPTQEGGARLFSAMLTERGRRLPLLIYAWESRDKEAKASRCIVFTETLFRLGGVTIAGGGVTVAAQLPDSQAERVLERVGAALTHLFPAAKSAGKEQGIRHDGDGWHIMLTPLNAEGG